jgi:hypothetical protein
MTLGEDENIFSNKILLDEICFCWNIIESALLFSHQSIWSSMATPRHFKQIYSKIYDIKK